MHRSALLPTGPRAAAAAAAAAPHDPRSCRHLLHPHTLRVHHRAVVRLAIASAIPRAVAGIDGEEEI